MLDSELERVDSGWLLEEQRGTMSPDSKSEDGLDYHVGKHHPHQSHIPSLLEHG